MKKIKFKDVAHHYLGCLVVDLETWTHHRLQMIGVNDPSPLLVDGQWRSFEQIKPVLYHRENLPPLITKRLKEDVNLSGSNPDCWAHLAHFYCQHGVDIFNLIENEEAHQRENQFNP